MRRTVTAVAVAVSVTAIVGCSAQPTVRTVTVTRDVTRVITRTVTRVKDVPVTRTVKVPEQTAPSVPCWEVDGTVYLTSSAAGQDATSCEVTVTEVAPLYLGRSLITFTAPDGISVIFTASQ
jgi:hypothetical protein